MEMAQDSMRVRGSFRHLLAVPSFYRLGFAAGRRLPVRVLYTLAEGLALATYVVCRSQAGTLRANLARLLPAGTDRERARLARTIFRNYARYLVDYARFHRTPPGGFETVLPALEGGDNLRQAFEAGRGVILVTGHIGNWELGGMFFGHQGVKVNVVTLPDGNDRIDAIREMYREQYAVATIVLDGSPFASLEMMAALRRNEMLAMLVDQWGKSDGVPVRFLGRPFYLPRGPFVLSRATGAPILPAFVVRDGSSYRGIVEPPFVVEQDDFEGYATRLAGSLERIIRRYPEQWYNVVPL